MFDNVEMKSMNFIA